MNLVLESLFEPRIVSIHYKGRNSVGVYTGTQAISEKRIRTLKDGNRHLNVCGQIMHYQSFGHSLSSNPIVGALDGNTFVATSEAAARFFPHDGLCMVYASEPNRPSIEAFIKDVELKRIPGLSFEWDRTTEFPMVHIHDGEGESTVILLRPGMGGARPLSVTAPTRSRTAGILMAMAKANLVHIAFANDDCGVIIHPANIGNVIQRARGHAQITLANLGLCESPFDSSKFAWTGRMALVL